MVKPIDYLQKFSPRKENKEENNLKVLPWLLNFFNVICVEIKTLPVRSWHDVIRDMIDSKPTAWKEEAERRNKQLINERG